MAGMNGDLAVRSALADLTDGQPPMPPGRFQAVRRRVARRRRQQLAAAVVCAVAVTGVVVGLVRLPAVVRAQPQARHVPGWALRWPDHRNGSVPQSVLNGAVLAWRHEAPAVTSPAQIARHRQRYQVIWYVGQTIDHGRIVVVMFEVNGPAGRQLVAGFAPASQVMRDQPGWCRGLSPWVLLVADAGQLMSDVLLTGMSASDGHIRLPNIPLGVPGARPGVPPVDQPPAPIPPTSFNFITQFGLQGQGGFADGALPAGVKRYVLLGRCNGPQSLRIRANGHGIGSIGCDGGQHELTVPTRDVHGHKIFIGVNTSELTAWYIDLGSSR
jgi:hypothetical protein